MKDWRGTPIVNGSIVVYPGRQGSNVWLNEARVLMAGVDGKDWRGNDKPILIVERLRESHFGTRDVDNKQVTLRRISNVTVVAPPTSGLDAI